MRTKSELLTLAFLYLISDSLQANVVESVRPKKDKDDGKSSLVFVFDTTGSMFNDLRQLREGAEMILKTALEDSSVIADFVFVPFHDPAVGPATVTKDKHVFKSALNIVRVYGGGDCPEKSLGGIQLALSVSRPRSFVYVFTDATASDHKLVGTVLDSIQRTQSQVVFVLTGHCNDLQKPSYKVYQQIASASAGQVFNLNKTSVHKVLDFVRSSIKGRTVNLASVVNPAGYNHTREIPVDKSVGEVTVSVSGAKPQIKVVNPSGKEITGPPQLVTTLDLSEIMIVKVLQPEPGNWSITVGSEEEHSVKVVGLSNLTFQHGFSVQKPKSLDETSYRPLQGTYNNMLISVSGTNDSLHLDHVELLGLEGKPLFEVPLKLMDEKRNLYLVDAFVPPDEFFYIAINGRDEFGQDIRRVGSTAVQAKSPDVPYLTAPQRIEARSHERVILSCHVDSLVPITAMWTRDSMRVQPQINSLQSTTIEYVIEDMTERHVGSYRCVARNAAGVGTVTTEVDMIVDAPRVTISPINTTISEQEDLTISCVVFSEALLQRAQITFAGPKQSYATDINLLPTMDGYYAFNQTIHGFLDRDAGSYSCIAANRGGTTHESSYINIQAKPAAQILGPHTLTKSIHSDLQIICQTEHALEVQWLDPSNNIVQRNSANGSYTSILDVKNVTEDGVWTCLALRDSYKATDKLDLSVLMKPKVHIEGSKNISIINGTMLEINCTVVAKPEPRILWHMETERFLPNVVSNPEPNVYKSMLTLDSGKEDVNRTFFCFGENSEGIGQDSAVVNVRRKMVLIQGFEDKSVELYSQIEFHCHIDSYPPPTIAWYHNNTSIHTNEHVRISDDNTTLSVLRVDFKHLGEYECEASNEFESLLVNGSLSVHGLEKPVISKEINKIVTELGNSTIMTCRIVKGSPKPIIKWQYRRTVLDNFTNLSEDVVNEETNDIVFGSVTKRTGLYRCIATNIIGEDRHDVELVVQYPPELEISLEPRFGRPNAWQSGERISLSCDASALPPPVVTWTKDDLPLAYSSNVYLNEDNNLIIEKATRFDSGLFTCTATNTLGSVSKNFTIDVYTPPIITISGVDSEVEVTEGQLVELPCSARGDPSPTIRWFHNDRPVRGARRMFDEYGLRFVANLTDFGAYRCVASNEYGTVFLNYTVYVWAMPHIEQPLEEYKDVLSGTDVHFECNAVGFPLPTVNWEYQDEPLKYNTTDISFDDSGNLFIKNASLQHEGIYSCIVENIAGMAQKYFFVTINDAPKIEDNDYTGPYIASNKDINLTIMCKASGKPRPYIVWIKDGFYLDKDDRYEIDRDALTIKHPSEELSGVYTCVAKNIIGNATKDIPVKIYSVPEPVQAEESNLIETVEEGSNVELPCPVRASDHTVKWYKDAILISNNTLFLPNISRTNASTYACVATNAVGSAHVSIVLKVVWKPKFLFSEDEAVEVVKGDDYYLDCKTDANPRAKVKWLFNSKPLLGQDKDVLKLLNIQLRHTGIYKCIVSNDYGTVFKQFSIDVLEPPFLSDFNSLEVQLKAGTKASLECIAKGFPKPTISWTFNNTNWSVQNLTLLSTNITNYSEGLFICTASNKAGVTHITYRVIVVSGAVVENVIAFVDGVGTNVQDNLDLVLNNNARIACKAKGKPSPIIQWIQNGRILSQNTEGIGYADLLLERIDTSKSGIYSCIASNEGGVNERTIRISILEPPKIYQTLYQNTNSSHNIIELEVLSGQAFYMHCHPYGNPVPSVYWFKDGVPLKLYDDSMVSSDFGEIVVAKSAMYEQSGNYTCVAKNKVGEASVMYLVDVLVPPPIQKDSIKETSTLVGSALNLTCPAEGRPLPLVMWVKHPYTEVEESSRVQLVNDNYTLIITETEVSDSGKYSCIMTNKVGTTELVYDVTIEKPPSIAGDDTEEKHVVPLKRSIVLKCEVDGYPRPNITWIKDIQPLSNSAASIHYESGISVVGIWDAGTRDAGQYLCLANNSAGIAQRRYQVVLQVPGKWSAWSQWSYCNVTCALGYQRRERRCQYIDDNNRIIDKISQPDHILLDESSCKGLSMDKRKCHMPPCEEEETQSRWSGWSKWSVCSVTCGLGTQARTRRCRGKAACIGDNVQVRKCPGLPKCRFNREKTNDMFSGEDVNLTNPDYLPEATFEMDSDGTLETPQSGLADEFYIPPESPPPKYFDVIVTENLDNSERGPCEAGYRYIAENQTCEDIDECEVDSNQCHLTQVCANTLSGYRCGCPEGYSSLGAGQRCLDINECLQDAHGCEFACVNVAGGYVCACPPSMRLHKDRHHCVSPTPYRKTFTYEEPEASDYISTSIEYPERYMKRSRYYTYQ